MAWRHTESLVVGTFERGVASQKSNGWVGPGEGRVNAYRSAHVRGKFRMVPLPSELGGMGKPAGGEILEEHG